MKKLSYLLLGLAGLSLASCSQDDDLFNSVNGDGNFNVTVKLPGDLATRSLSDGLTADSLQVAIYTADGQYIESQKFVFGSSLTTTVSLNLVPGTSYNIAFFAQSLQSSVDDVYVFDGQQGMFSVNYGNMTSDGNNADAYDCFYNLLTTGVIGSTNMQTDVTLYRPIAKINWGSNDYGQGTVANAFGVDYANVNATLTTDVYTQYNLLQQDVIAESKVQNMEIGRFTPATTATFPVDGTPAYKYVAMQYVLAPKTTELFNLSLNVLNADNEGTATTNTTIDVSSAPLQANYQTNIYGSLLSENIQFTVDKSADWGGNYQIVESSSAFADAVKAGGSVILNSDIALDDRITLVNDVVVDLNGHSITYSPAENPYDRTKEGAFYVPEGVNLTIKGDGDITAATYYTLVFVAGGQANIEGGNFTGPIEAGNFIYVESGVAYVSGGSYYMDGVTPDTTDAYYLNCYDSGYNDGVAHIYVTGGNYYNWNPAQNHAEGGNRWVSFLENGYQSVATTIDGEPWYVVVPQGETGETVKVVSNSTDLATAIGDNDGATIYLTPGTYTTPNVYTGNVTLKGLDAENTVLIATQAYWQANGDISLSDLTVKQFPQNGMSAGFNGATSGTFNNVTFQCEFHAMTGDNTFTNCTFSYDPQYYGETGRYNLWIESRTGGTTTVKDCQFNNQLSKGVLVYDNASSATNLSTMGNISIINCTLTSVAPYKGNAAVEIHSEYFKSAGTLTLTNCSYSGGYTALWQEKNNGTSEPTHFYTVIVNGTEVQAGGQTAGN